MDRKKISILILIIILFTPTFVFADIGPKPTTDFKITYENKPISTEFYAMQLSCGKVKLSEYSTQSYNEFNEMGLNAEAILGEPIYDSQKNCYWQFNKFSWGGDQCKDSACHFYYRVPSEFKLRVYIVNNGSVFVSEPVKTSAFYSTYSANLKADGSIEIKDKTLFFRTNLFKYLLFLLISLIITIIIEISVAELFISKNLNKQKIRRTIIYANMVSLPILWAVLFLLFNGLNSYWRPLLIGEILIIIFEWLFIYFLNKKSTSIAKTLVMVLVMNILSFIIGIILDTFYELSGKGWF